ncbi:MAG: ATP-dependent Clp protease adapter ClpS [Pseudomonadota bacterium]
MSEEIPGDDAAVEASKPQLKRPPKYKVLLHNDDFTPMDFVVWILESFFQMGHEQANRVMWQVHTEGIGVAGIFTREIAETKVEQVTERAREHQHPLKCTMEAA